MSDKKYQSQNNEVEVVLNYFGGGVGYLLDIGANDGKTLSNSYDLINRGWNGALLEPDPFAYQRLWNLQYEREKEKIEKWNFGIAAFGGLRTIFSSGSHLGNDTGLLSTLHKKETDKWGMTVEFNEEQGKFMMFDEFMKKTTFPGFNFISIDAEGEDWNILQQMNLVDLGCECLCIEHNGNKDFMRNFADHCWKHGLKEIHRNQENIIFGL